MRGRSHIGDFLEQLEIFRALAEFIISQKRTEGSAAENAEFFLIYLFEESTLIEFRRALQIPQQILFAAIEDLDLQHFAGLALVEHVLQAAPGCFQLLE